MLLAKKMLVGHGFGLEKCWRSVTICGGDDTDSGLDTGGGEQWVLLTVEQQDGARGDAGSGLGVVFGAAWAVHGVGGGITLVGH